MVCGSAMLAAMVLARQGRGEKLLVTVDGVQRDALVFAPAAASDHPPVVFAFHGHTGTAGYAAGQFGFQDQWPEAIVVYPQGLPRVSALVDPEGKYSGWDTGGTEDNPDVKFVDALYKAVMDKYHGDPAHVFAVGHSNGGSFIYTLWALRPKLFAGLASAEAGGARRYKLEPKPIFVTIRSQDRVVPPVIQHASFSDVLRVNGSKGASQAFGGSAALYPGTVPTVLWSYDGSHVFPHDSVEWMVKFFKSLGSP